MKRTVQRGLLSQHRNASFAVPEDGIHEASVRNESAQGLTSEKRAFYKLGASSSWPGHGYMYNVSDPEEPVPLDPITGKPEVADRGMLGEWVPKLPVTAKSAVHKDVVALKKNPPINFNDRYSNEAKFMGSPWNFAGGSLDPYLKAGMIGGNKIVNAFATHVAESPEGIVNNTFDSGSVKDSIMHQPLFEEPEVAKIKPAILQTAFTAKHSDMGFKELPLLASARYCDAKQPGRLEEEVKYHLSTAGQIFRVDGSCGSTNDDEVRTQAFCDNAAHALFYTSIFHRPPQRDFWKTNSYSPPVRIFHAAGYEFERERVIEEFGGPKPKDLGLEHDKFVLVDPYSKPAAALIAGVLDLDLTRSVTAYLHAIVMYEELDILTIPGDATYDAATGEVTVHVNAKNAPQIRAQDNLFGAHYLTLSPDGLGRMFDGVTLPYQGNEALAPKYSLVTDDGTTKSLTKPLNRRFNDPSTARKSHVLHGDLGSRPVHVRYNNVDALAGMTLSNRTSVLPESTIRPNIVATGKVKIVFHGAAAPAKDLSAADAAKLYAAAVAEGGWPYANHDDLVTSFTQAVTDGGIKCSAVGSTNTSAPKATSTPKEPEAAPSQPATPEPEAEPKAAASKKTAPKKKKK